MWVAKETLICDGIVRLLRGICPAEAGHWRVRKTLADRCGNLSVTGKSRFVRLAGLSLPDAFDSVTVEDRVDTDKRYSQFQRLSRKQTVEWIAMVKWQQPRPNCMDRIDGN